ncbi:hypothetical protein ACWFRQ_18955 [Streptomyces niveus]
MAEYARNRRIGDHTLYYWLRDAERYGLNQELVNLAVQNRVDAYASGSKNTDYLHIASDMLPSVGAPDGQDLDFSERQESPPPPQEYPSNVAVSSYAHSPGFNGTPADTFPQEYPPGTPSDQTAQAGEYARFLQAAGAGQLSASHFALPDRRTYTQHELPRVSGHDAAKDAKNKGKSSRHRH